MDLVERAGQLKPMLVSFALSPRFERELSAVLRRNSSGDSTTDSLVRSQVIDQFALQHRLPSGSTVVEAFVAAHSELTGPERDMLLGWQDVVEGTFEITGQDRDALVLHNFLDELTYRARSNLGGRAFEPLKKGMILITRLVRVGEDWMVSGNPLAYPASSRGPILSSVAEQALRNPKAVFRNPAKLAEARRTVAYHYQVFVELFGTDLIVVPGGDAPGRVDAFHRHVAELVRPGENPQVPELDLPDELLTAESVAIHFCEGYGLSYYRDYHLLADLFSDPALISRRAYREALSSFLRDPEISPEPLRRLAALDPAKASTIFTRLLNRKRGFSWDADGEELLRKHKPGYFDGTMLPWTVSLSSALSGAYGQTAESSS